MTKARALWENGLKIGVIGGVAAVIISLVGMVESFNQRDIIAEVVTMGQVLLMVVGIMMGYIAAKRTEQTDPVMHGINAIVASLVIGSALALLVVVGDLINLRSVLVNASPVLYKLLTLGHKGATGVFIIRVYLRHFCDGSLLFSTAGPTHRRCVHEQHDHGRGFTGSYSTRSFRLGTDSFSQRMAFYR